MHFERYAAFFRPEELDTLTAAFEATWCELTASGADLSSEEKVASLKKKLAQRILVSATAGGARDIETIKGRRCEASPGTFVQESRPTLQPEGKARLR